MSGSFPQAGEQHFRSMLKFPNQKQTFITCSGGEMQSIPYLYSLLSLPDNEQALYILHERYTSTIVAFTVGQLREFRQIQRNHK